MFGSVAGLVIGVYLRTGPAMLTRFRDHRGGGIFTCEACCHIDYVGFDGVGDGPFLRRFLLLLLLWSGFCHVRLEFLLHDDHIGRFVILNEYLDIRD